MALERVRPWLQLGAANRCPDQPQGPATAQHGLTLIEQLLSVLLVALLTVWTLPSFDAVLQRRQVQGVSQQLVADLQYLRSLGLARQMALRLSVQSPSSGAGGCYLVHTGAADACTCSGETITCSTGTELLRSYTLPADTRLRLRANVPSLRMDPRQGTFSPTGSIEITGGDGGALKHVINLLGRVRICASAGRWAGVPAC